MVVFVVAMAAISVIVALSAAGQNTSDVDSANIVNGSVQNEDLKTVDSAVDEQCLTFESSIGDFEWQDCSITENTESIGIVASVQKGSPGTINPGQAIYASGFDLGAGVVEVELADATSASTMPSGAIARGTITDTLSGDAVFSGRLAGVDTSSWSVGDAIYVGTTPGLLTNVRPGNGYLVQTVGLVVRSHPLDGRIAVVGAGRANDIPNISDDNVFVGSSTDFPTETAIVDCDANVLARLQYDTTTNAFSCENDIDLELPGDIVFQYVTATTLGAAATTFDVDGRNLVRLNGDAGGNTIATITGGENGQLIIIQVDSLGGGVTFTDNASPTADQMGLAGNHVVATVQDTLTLMRIGGVWLEVTRSVN